MSKRVLITGGAGFIGRASIAPLQADGWSVSVLDNMDPQVHGASRDRYDVRLGPDVEFVPGDVRSAAFVRSMLKEADAVLHLAAKTGVGQSQYDMVDYCAHNIHGTANLLECIADLHWGGRLVLASSRAVYGEGAYECTNGCGVQFPCGRGRDYLVEGSWDLMCPNCGGDLHCIPTNENAPLSPGSVYAVTKMTQEQLCRNAANAYGLSVVILRYFNVYGPGQPLSNPYCGIIPAFASQVLGGKAPNVYEDGNCLRDFVHVSDVAAANCLALKARPEFGKVLTFNVGGGDPRTIFSMALNIAMLLGGGPEPQVTGTYRLGDIRHSMADLSLARTWLGYTPQVGLVDGLMKMLPWLRENFLIDNSEKARKALADRGLLGQKE